MIPVRRNIQPQEIPKMKSGVEVTIIERARKSLPSTRNDKIIN